VGRMQSRETDLSKYLSLARDNGKRWPHRTALSLQHDVAQKATAVRVVLSVPLDKGPPVDVAHHRRVANVAQHVQTTHPLPKNSPDDSAVAALILCQCGDLANLVMNKQMLGCKPHVRQTNLSPVRVPLDNAVDSGAFPQLRIDIVLRQRSHDKWHMPKQTW